MMSHRHHSPLAALQDEKGLTQEQRVRLAAANSALSPIMLAIGTEGNDHRLEEEIRRYPGYVSIIESTLPFGKR